MLTLPSADPEDAALRFATRASSATNPEQQLADAVTSLAWSAIRATPEEGAS